MPWTPKDDAECEALLTPDDRMCTDVQDGWYCTREKGHEGDHVASGIGAIYHRWPYNSSDHKS